MNQVQTYALIVAGLLIQSRPFPDAEAFRKDLPVIVNIRDAGNRALAGSLAQDPILDQYTFKQQTTEIILDSKGKTRSTTIEVFELTRSAITGKVYRRPILTNGEPVSGELPSKSVTSTTSAPPPLRDPVAEERDIQALYEIHANSESIDGHSVIALTLRPNPRYKPKTQLGEWQQHFLIRAWLTEKGHEVIRQESEVITDITDPRGLIKKGTMIKMERQLINGEVWIPVRTELHLIGGFLPKGEQGTFIKEYSEFKKFVVDVELKP